MEERQLGAIFYVGKVHALECVATVDGVMIVTWYWPKMRRRSTNAMGEWHQRYANWEARCWKPSEEDDDNTMVKQRNDIVDEPDEPQHINVHGMWCTNREKNKNT